MTRIQGPAREGNTASGPGVSCGMKSSRHDSRTRTPASGDQLTKEEAAYAKLIAEQEGERLIARAKRSKP